MIGGFSPNVYCIGVVFGVTALILGFGASMSVFTSSLWSPLLLLPCKTAELLTLSISLLPVLAESFALALVVLPEAPVPVVAGCGATSSIYAAGSASC